MKNVSYPYQGIASVLLSITVLLPLSGCETTKPMPVGCASTKEEISQAQQRAEAGDPEAQYRMGGWYVSRFCLQRDVSKAKDWYQRAADQGYPKAQYSLGQMYFHGYGAPKDIERGINWYHKAADKGHVEAQVKLASFHRTDLRDMKGAVRWYEKAAKQGDLGAIRSLGYIYLHGEGVQKDLDQAEKWFHLAVQKGDSSSRATLEQIKKDQNPAAWKRRQEEVRRAEKEKKRRQQRLLAEEKERDLKQKQANITQRANKAKARFGLVRVSIVEETQSKKARLEVRRELESMREPKGLNTSSRSDEVTGAAIESIFHLGPYGPLIVAYAAAIVYGIEGIKKGVKSRKERAKIRPSIETLNKTFSQEDIEADFTAELLAAATQQQASGLLVSDSDNTAGNASHHLKVQVKHLRMITVPPSWNMARLWATVEVTLTNRKADDSAFKKRFCYGGSSFSIEKAAKDDSVFQQQLNELYRGLSSQILSEALGLAADDNAPLAWGKTAKMCSSVSKPTKVAGGHYIGEMKDGKPHGYGEMRYQHGIHLWVSTYRGNFVNGKAHGAGRCRTRRGGWWDCTFENGRRF